VSIRPKRNPGNIFLHFRHHKVLYPTNAVPATFTERQIRILRSGPLVGLVETLRIEFFRIRVVLRVVMDSHDWHHNSHILLDCYVAIWNLVVGGTLPEKVRLGRVLP
jgi:hypothetical protein